MLQSSHIVPQELDLDRLTQLVAARRASAEDDLWLLREDPSYFIHSLRDEKEHVFEAASCGAKWKMAARLDGALGLRDGRLRLLRHRGQRICYPVRRCAVDVTARADAPRRMDDSLWSSSSRRSPEFLPSARCSPRAASVSLIGSGAPS